MSEFQSYQLKVLLIFVFGLGVAVPVWGQVDNTYFRADQLLQQNRYEEAYTLFKELHRNNPGSYIFFEKATECLISLKKYDEAVELAEHAMHQELYPDQAGIRLGEIYHIRGDTSEAFHIWDEVLRDNADNLQIHLTLARTLHERRAFDKAVQVYLKADEMLQGRSSSFSTSPVILSELADTYMQAGEYEKAIRKYLALVKESPDRISHIQSTLLRLNDKNLYDIAILEIHDFLKKLPSGHPGHRGLHQLEVWLLLERELYERALVVAKEYEQARSEISYSLYSVGTRLLSERKFDLAEEAFSYYIDNNVRSAKYPSMEELANVYIEWADYLADYNLAHHSMRDSLYKKAYNTLERIIKEEPSYTNKNSVLSTLAELALDHLYSPEQAVAYLRRLNGGTDSSYLAKHSYLQGRIYLYYKKYARARIAFTKSAKAERIGILAEKARYYLALTDFYDGDYEFAKIQLNALERQNTSYFANDAVQLRVWIQEGLQADSTGKIIGPFAQAVEQFAMGEKEQAIQQLVTLLRKETYHPLTDEALLELCSNVQPSFVQLTYSLLDRYLQSQGRYSPLRERLMWEKARIADQLSHAPDQLASNRDYRQPDSTGADNLIEYVAIPTAKDQIITLYENLLMEYPQGFYAAFARNRIQELQKPQT